MSEKVCVQPEVPVFTKILAERGTAAGFTFTEMQLQQFSRYYELLILANNQFNLTALTSPEDVAVKHMIDSLLAYDAAMQDGKTLLDVGSGAGFPGLVLKIYRPGLRVTLLDALTKRLTFLNSVIQELSLLDTIPAIDRAKSDKINYLAVAPMFAEAIERIYEEVSVSKLFV